MSRRITKAKRRFLLAVVRDAVCGHCEEQPAFMGTLTCLGCWREDARKIMARWGTVEKAKQEGKS